MASSCEIVVTVSYDVLSSCGIVITAIYDVTPSCEMVITASYDVTKPIITRMINRVDTSLDDECGR